MMITVVTCRHVVVNVVDLLQLFHFRTRSSTKDEIVNSQLNMSAIHFFFSFSFFFSSFKI